MKIICIFSLFVTIAFAADSCTNEYQLFNGQCYVFYPNSRNPNIGSAHCQADGAVFTSILSAFENNFLLSLASTKAVTSVWIGLYYDAQAGVYRWPDGTALGAYSNWLTSFPNSNIGYCVVMSVADGGKWKNVDCTMNYPFFCKTSDNVITTTPSIGLPTEAHANPNDTATYEAYRRAADYFRASINVSADPCNDFYGYACSNYPQTISFDVVDNMNFRTQAMQMKNATYLGANTPLPLKQTVWFFNKCKQVVTDPSSITTGDVVRQALTNFQSATGLTFPMLDQSQTPTALSPTIVANAVGYLSGHFDVDTLISYFVDTDWKNPNGTPPYRLFVDQNTLVYRKSYYQPGAWNITIGPYRNYITQLLTTVASVYQLPLDPTQLASDVEQILNLELTLARMFSTDETTRRRYERMYNPYSVNQASTAFTFIDWPTYLRQLFADAPASVQTQVNQPSFVFIVAEVQQISNLMTIFNAGNPYNIQNRDIVNYFNFRLIDSLADYLPDAGRLAAKRPSRLYRPPLGRPKYIRRRERVDWHTDGSKGDDATDILCAAMTVDLIQYANARFFVDALYSDGGAGVRRTAGDVIDNILGAFNGMIDQLPWMTRASKAGAYFKIQDLIKNIAFPDFILDDAALTSYYSALTIAASDDFVTMMFKLAAFNRYLQFNYLSVTDAANRHDFLGPPGIVNAWYQPEVNSITFPAGILQPPFFDALWPASINYGAIGVVAGHELTHGFDDEGVQWDGDGQLAAWLDAASANGFDRMARCVINEYNGFCPLPATYTPHCVNGEQTQGENIADNGGIHAAFRAYRNHVAMYGPDPRLPDALIGQFNHDQLFFLSFAQVWCSAHRSDAAIYKQLLVDPHSPYNYRVWGSIQNYPAFQSAFNCPLGTAYAPNQRCNVWVLDNN
jgi:membrane metallo-endopeptidase-like protein 1